MPLFGPFLFTPCWFLPSSKSSNKTIVVISDANPEDLNLIKMLDLFERQAPYQVTRIELNETQIKGGCIGCLKCGSGDACFYQDDYPDAEVTAQSIQNLVTYLKHWTTNPEWRFSQTFLGVGGQKVFRDLVYENRAVMCADYNFYKDEKLLDFPNTNFIQRLQSRIMMTLQKIPSIQKAFKKDMNKHRLAPYRKLLEQMPPLDDAGVLNK